MFFKKGFLKKYKEKIRKLKNKYDNFLKIERNKYISILNHDIKTPILAQNQTLELLLENSFGALEKTQREIISDIYSSNKFLLEVVLNALFLAKYENEKINLKLEEINFVEQIKDCCEIIKNQAFEKKQNIIIKTNKVQDIKLDADRKLIQKIILNILSSSITSGFENSDIEILIQENKNSILFCTKNKSVYMTKEKINSLLKDKENVKDFNQLGANLNLNIAQKLITAHSWDVIANSDRDNSSTFGFVVKK
jgi:signal transduction histidine kinase